MVAPEGFEYYVDRSSANDDRDGCLFMSDLDYEGNGSVGLANVSSGSWQSTDLQINRTGEIRRFVLWSGNPVDLKGKRPKLCAVNNPQGDTAVQEFEAELEISTRASVDFRNDTSVVQSPKLWLDEIAFKFCRRVVKYTSAGNQLGLLNLVNQARLKLTVFNSLITAIQ